MVALFMIRFSTKWDNRMVSFSHNPSPVYSDFSLATWLQLQREKMRADGRIDADDCIQIEMQADLENVGFCEALLPVISQVLLQAVQLAASDQPVEVSVYGTRRGLEIEIATTVGACTDESLSAFRRESTMVSNGYHLTTYHARCPQGGVAWIIVQSQFARMRMIA